MKQRILERRSEAEERSKKRNRRSPKEQLALLDKRPGKSRRERKKLEICIGLQILEDRHRRKKSSK